MTKRALSTRQAAILLGVRLESLYKLIYASRLLATKVNGVWEVDAASIEDYASHHSRKRGAQCLSR
jgi:hypothetical protein